MTTLSLSQKKEKQSLVNERGGKMAHNQKTLLIMREFPLFLFILRRKYLFLAMMCKTNIDCAV